MMEPATSTIPQEATLSPSADMPRQEAPAEATGSNWLLTYLSSGLLFITKLFFPGGLDNLSVSEFTPSNVKLRGVAILFLGTLALMYVLSVAVFLLDLLQKASSLIFIIVGAVSIPYSLVLLVIYLQKPGNSQVSRGDSQKPEKGCAVM